MGANSFTDFYEMAGIHHEISKIVDVLLKLGNIAAVSQLDGQDLAIRSAVRTSSATTTRWNSTTSTAASTTTPPKKEIPARGGYLRSTLNE